MRNITSLVLEKYNDSSAYEHMGNHIYKNLSDGNFNISFSCELEENEDTQYPLEDILDKFYVNCTDYIDCKIEGTNQIFTFELEGSLMDNDENLENIKKVSELIGKKVYNSNINGSVILVIED